MSNKIRLPCGMELQHRQELLEERLLAAEDGDSIDSPDDIRTELREVESLRILAELVPLLHEIDEWIGNEPMFKETVEKLGKAHGRIHELLEQIELEH